MGRPTGSVRCQLRPEGSHGGVWAVGSLEATRGKRKEPWCGEQPGSSQIDWVSAPRLVRDVTSNKGLQDVGASSTFVRHVLTLRRFSTSSYASPCWAEAGITGTGVPWLNAHRMPGNRSRIESTQKPREGTGGVSQRRGHKTSHVKGSVGAKSDQETGCAWWKKP